MDIFLGVAVLALFIGYALWSEWRVSWRQDLLEEAFRQMDEMSKTIKELTRGLE